MRGFHPSIFSLLAIFFAFPHRISKIIRIFATEYMFNRTNPDRERVAEATAGGSVYRRSQPGRWKRNGREQWCKDGEWKVCYIKLHRDMEAS